MSQALIDNVRDQLKKELDDRAVVQQRMDDLIGGVEERDDASLTEEETTQMGELRDELRSLDETRADLEQRVADLEEDETRKAAAAELAKTVGAPKENRNVQTVTVTNEPDIYNEHSEHSFFADALAAPKGNAAAQDRLARHQAHETKLETRDIGTSAAGALVVPQYLTNLFAENLTAGRPFLNAVQSLPLPNEGMTINIPRGTTATSVAAQSAENAALDETDFDETTLTVNVRTYGGQQDVSRQAIDRGRGVDSIIYADLVAQYAATSDADAIAADGTSGTHLGVLSVSGTNAVAYTDASPTVAECYPKIADAIQRVNSNRYMPADLIVMHPRRWGWFMSNVDSSSRPLVVPAANMPQNAFGVGTNGGVGVVGQIMGVTVVVDANIPTTLGGGTEDAILVMRASDAIIMEEASAPRRFEFEQTAGGNLTVKLGVFGYQAFTAGRYPTGISKITGTGLAAPTF